MSRRTLGWAAVGAQFALIAAILGATGAAGPSPTWLWWIGTVCLIAGTMVMLAAFLGLGRALTPTPVPNGASLRTDGAYRFVRHPIYSGLLLAMLGVVLHSIGVWPAAAWLALLALLSVKARWEERMLAEIFPGYDAYAAATGRFIPRP